MHHLLLSYLPPFSFLYEQLSHQTEKEGNRCLPCAWDGQETYCKDVFMETLITTVVSIAGGLAAGIVFSKLSYLGLLKILHFEVGFKFSISVSSIGKTVVLFAVIFSMTLIYNLLQIKLSNTMELLLGGKKERKSLRRNG